MSDERVAAAYRKYGGIIYARCKKILGDEAEAEDATQESFLRLHRHLARLDDPQEAIRWIYRVATNYCFSELRSRRHRPIPVERVPDIAIEHRAEDSMMDRDLVRGLLARVPEKVRTAAWLHFAEGFGQDEVAQILGLSRRTIASRILHFKRSTQRAAGEHLK
ncbi:MAG: sigma-70 family RNA polymerase sigma factor [Deltaproteobacteria bacterium]|nr:sigma-70 family RNA polymerase sigma factor [Deltaproteobacteria bacterium]